MTEIIVPSFVAKLGRAEKHLVELQAAISEFGGTEIKNRPYTVRKRVEGKRNPPAFRIHFTRNVENTAIPLIAADAIYNMRSAMDHLVASLVASSDRRSVMFPIFWRGVWKPAVEGETSQRTKDRERWASVASKLPEEAVTYLKRLQPPDETPGAETAHHLRILNRLANLDRHTKLPLLAVGLDGMVVRNYRANGAYIDGVASPKPDSFFEDDALLGVPKGTVRAEIAGTIRVVIRSEMKYPDGNAINLPVVDFINDGIPFIRDTIIPNLAPFIRDRKLRRAAGA